MKTTKIFHVITLGIAAIGLALAYWLKDLKTLALISFFWVVLWGISRVSHWDSSPSFFFFVYAGLCGVGSFMELRLILLLVGILAALAAWDIDRFLRRWQDTETNRDDRALEKKHLVRLLVVIALGFLVSGAGLVFRYQLSFGLMLLAGAVALISLSQMIRFLRESAAKK